MDICLLDDDEKPALDIRLDYMEWTIVSASFLVAVFLNIANEIDTKICSFAFIYALNKIMAASF